MPHPIYRPLMSTSFKLNKLVPSGAAMPLADNHAVCGNSTAFRCGSARPKIIAGSPVLYALSAVSRAIFKSAALRMGRIPSRVIMAAR